MHLADIAPSIFSSLGLIDPHGRTAFTPSPTGRECLLLVDGLGAEAINEYAKFVPTLSKLLHYAPVETAFPSTTATSLATLMTGELPGTHGMLGYTVRVPRSGGRILNALKWDERVDPHTWQPVPTFFERGAAAGIEVSNVSAKRYEDSGFTRAALRGGTHRSANTITEMVEQTKVALRKSPSFAYLYVNEVDVAGHSDGVGSEKWLAALNGVDLLVATLMSKLPQGVRLWVTADHGMVNVTESIILGEGNPLLDGVAVIAGEPRARHIYLEEKHLTDVAQIATRMGEFLGVRAVLLNKSEAISQGLFGEHPSEAAQERMGEIIIIARGGLVLIEKAKQDQELAMVGHHGALTDTERFVPLLSYEID